MRSRTALVGLSIVGLVLFVGHLLDHARHGELLAELGPGSRVLMVVVLAAHIAMVALAVRRHALAPSAAVNLGFGNVAGPMLFHHVLPHWGALSGVFTEVHADALSWTFLAAIMVNGLALGLAGIAATRRSTRDRVRWSLREKLPV
jgi:formate hydrogenlyase subunit 3/multisubunit Na+/H+ antiporter MnhD subunit